MEKCVIFFLLMIPALAFAEETLLEAVMRGDVAFIRNYKGDINRPMGKGGETALEYAIDNMRPDSAAALIEAKADVNKADARNGTPLMSAALSVSDDAGWFGC